MSGSAANGLKGSDITIEIAQDLSSATFIINKLVLAAGENAEINGTKSTGWNMKEPFIIPLNDEGVFTFEVNSIGAITLATCSSQELDWATWQAASSISTDATTADPAPVAWGKDLTLTGKMSHIVTVSGNLKTITVTPETAETAKIFLVGDHNGYAMKADDPTWQFEKGEDGNYYLDCTEANPIPAGKNFQISARGWANSPVCYFYNGQISDEHLSTPVNAKAMTWSWGASTGANFASVYTGTIRLDVPVQQSRADGDNASVYFFNSIVPHNGTSTGINAAEVVNDAPAEYFNLQGVRVDNPAAGLYIMRKGNKVSKVFIK